MADHSQPAPGGHTACNAQHFDTEAAQWEQSRPYLKDWAAQVFQAYETTAGVQLTVETKVLDCGCGTGLLSELLAPHIAQVVGVDVSPNMVVTYNQKATTRGIVNMHALCLDVNDEAAVKAAKAAGQLPSAGFDAVCIHMTLHHVEDAGAALRALAALLKPGGHLLLSDITKSPMSDAFHPQCTRHTVAHPGGFSEGEVGSLFQSAGLRVSAYNPQAVLAPRQVPHEDGHTTTEDFHLFVAAGQRAME